MPDYKEVNVEARKWQRCKTITIENPYQGQAAVHMAEEEMADIGGNLVARGVPGMSFPFNPQEIIQLRNPSTGEPSGATVSMAEVYAILWSLYIGKAIERDTPPPVAPPADPLPEGAIG